MDKRFIRIQDHYDRLKDSVFYGRDSGSIKGVVSIYEQNKKENVKRLLNRGNNLIVYGGREVLVERLLNADRDSSNPHKDLFIAWVGVGNGAATVDDPFNPTLASLDNTDLANPLIVNPSKPEYADGGKKIPVQSVSFKQDPLFDNRWLIGVVQATIAPDDIPNTMINEVGLYLSNSSVPAEASVFVLFARYTFPSILKTDTFEVVIEWSLFF